MYKIFNKNNSLKKLLFGSFVVFALVSTSIHPASAIPVFDAGNFTQNLAQRIQAVLAGVTSKAQLANDIISSQANYSNTFKEYVLDPGAKILARQMLKQIETQSIAWINSGFKGKPLFIQNPELFVKNIATDQLIFVKNDLLRQVQAEVNGVTSQLRLANKDIAKYVISRIANESAIAKQNMVPTMGNTICTSMLNELNAIQDKTSLYFRSQKNNYDSSCVKIGNEYNVATVKNCAYDFNCSGWAGILSMTNDLDKNSEASRAAIVLAQTQAAIQKEKDKINAQLARSGGYLDQTVCNKYITLDDGLTVCDPNSKETINVGKTAETSVDQTLRNTSQEFIVADEFSEVLTNIASAFINKAINTGVAYVAQASTALANEIDQNLANLNSDINADIGGSISNGSNNNGGGTGNNGGGTGTGSTGSGGINPDGTINWNAYATPTPNTQYYLDTANRDVVLAMVKPIVEDAVTRNRKDLGFLDQKINAYQDLLDTLNTIAVCYESKSALTTSPYPDNIPLDMRRRASEVNSIILSLNAVKSKAIIAENSLLDKYNSLISVVDSRLFEIISNQIRNQGVNNPDLLTRGIYESQNSLDALGTTADTQDPAAQAAVLENPEFALYLRLQNEITALTEDVFTEAYVGDSIVTNVIPSPLSVCKNIGADTGTNPGDPAGDPGTGGGA